MSYDDRRQQQIIAEYRWKMIECDHQVDENFPLARMADNIWSRAFIEVFQQYELSERLTRLRAIIRRSMRTALDALGASVPPEESYLAGTMEREMKEILRRNRFELNQKASRDGNAVKRPRMATIIATELKSSLGTIGSRRGSPDARYFTTPVADWYLGTQVLFGPRVPFEISARLTLKRWPDEVVPLSDSLSILLPYIWMWEVVTEDDVKRVADSMNRVLSYALTIVPEIAAEITDYTPHPLGRSDHPQSTERTDTIDKPS